MGTLKRAAQHPFVHLSSLRLTVGFLLQQPVQLIVTTGILQTLAAEAYHESECSNHPISHQRLISVYCQGKRRHHNQRIHQAAEKAQATLQSISVEQPRQAAVESRCGQ